ncbi:hypothetical protein ACJX0J_026448, partial [Zea mays]
MHFHIWIVLIQRNQNMQKQLKRVLVDMFWICFFSLVHEKNNNAKWHSNNKNHENFRQNIWQLQPHVYYLLGFQVSSNNELQEILLHGLVYKPGDCDGVCPEEAEQKLFKT